MISQAAINRVRAEVPLLELARERGLEFRRKGADWWAPCPFHNEKSGSFKVSEKRNAYKCFGFGASGGVIQFWIAINGLDPKRGFPDAVRQLAQRAGIFIEETTGDAKDMRPKLKRRSRAEIEAEQERRKAMALAARAELARREIVKQWPWDVAQLCEDSPIQLDVDDVLGQARAVFRLFEPEDVVWAGDVQHSIQKQDLPEARSEWKREVSGHFRRASEWVRSGAMPGPRVCGCVFKPGAGGVQYSRSLDEVARPRFLVAEHDSLPMCERAAILRWMREKVGMRLRAVIFTGGKSLHGWFDYPLPHDVPRLRLMLCGMQVEEVFDGRAKRVWRGGLGFDPAIFNLVQPWKVPGWAHPKTGNMASLMWLASLRNDGRAVC